MKRVLRAMFVLAPMVSACASYDVEGLALVTPINSLIVGDTVTLSLVTLDGVVRPAADVSWTSSNETVATIDEAGVVLGTGPGTVVLEAKTGSYTLEVALLILETAGPFVQLGAGADHNCALAEDGVTWCWGRNEYGQLGTPSAPDGCPSPLGGTLPCAAGAIPVSGVTYTEIAVGSFHSCGISDAGVAYCWGLNDLGQLGDGGTGSGPSPLPVAGTNVFTSLSAGGRGTCGIRDDDALMCWGGGPHRVDGVTVDALTLPGHVADQHGFTLVAMSNGHTCGIATTATTYCWGLNDRGQLGVETVDSVCGSSPCTVEPQEVTSAPPFIDLALGNGFSCGLTAEGTVHCWGGNEGGALGDGTRIDRWESAPVAGGHVFASLASGWNHACGVDTSGALLCWGRSVVGIGTGMDFESDQPTSGAPGISFTETAIGFDSQCGRAPSEVTWCWGGNLDGAVGNGLPQTSTVTEAERVIRHPSFSTRVLGSG